MRGNNMNSITLLKLLSLIEAGMNFASLIAEVRVQESKGATPEDITKFIDDLYKAEIQRLNETN